MFLYLIIQFYVFKSWFISHSEHINVINCDVRNTSNFTIPENFTVSNYLLGRACVVGQH